MGELTFCWGKTQLVACTASMSPYSGVAGTEGWWRRGAVVVAGSPALRRWRGGASRRCSPLSDRVKVLRSGTVAAVNLVPGAAGPHLPFMGLRDGGPPAFHGLGAPDQGANQGLFGPLGPNGGDQY